MMRTIPTPEAQPSDSDPADEPALALRAIEDAYPGWSCWPGVINLLYARRARSSPPMVVRSTTLDGLREAIVRAEGDRGLR